MLASSSPTLTSAPASPAATFQNLRKSPYHAPRRRPSSTAAPPRPQVNSGPTAPQSQHSPVLSFARSPQFRHSPRSSSTARKYADAGTQYSPDGYPPTYRPTPSQTAPLTSLGPSPAQTAAPIERRETSADSAITEPPEPQLRLDPQPAVPAQITSPSRRVSRDKDKVPPRALQTPSQNETDAVSSEQSSHAKRARPQSGALKVMPLKYETCDVKDLGVLISDMLMELVRLNDDMPLRDGQLTRFHSR